MRAHPFLVVLTCVLALALGSCNTGKGGQQRQHAWHAASGQRHPERRRPVERHVRLEAVRDRTCRSRGMTQYQTIDAGSREVQVSVAGSSTNLIDVTPIFLPDVAYTFVAFRRTRQRHRHHPQRHVDRRSGCRHVPLRVINGASNNGGIDVYVTAPGEGLNTVSPSIAGVGYGSTSLFVNLPVGNREIRDHRGQLQAGHLRRAGAEPSSSAPTSGDRLFARQQYAGQCRLSQLRRHRHWIDRQ